MIHPLVSENNQVYNSKLEDFDFTNPPVNPVEFAQELIENMKHYKGMGLAANQLGFPYRVFAFDGKPPFVCFNPVIISSSTETANLVEGCLTYPHLWIKMKRPDHVRARFQDPFGNVITKVFGGYNARCFLHELDHLNGINYTMKADRFHLDQAKRKQKVLLRR